MAVPSPTTGKMAMTAEAITASFSIPVIPRILGDLMYKSIYKSTLGGRGHGLLGLTMTPLDYTCKKSNWSVPPVNPQLNLVFPSNFSQTNSTEKSSDTTA
eukprot:7761275-Ditylum_brightwellii.AAC.1